MTNDVNQSQASGNNGLIMPQVFINTVHRVLASNKPHQKQVAMSKKASNATNVYYKPLIKNVEMRYSKLSNRTLRH